MSRDKNTIIYRPGFTMIELLSVIAVIGLLSTISIMSFMSSRSRSRDAARINDIEQIAIALEFYYTDHGHYPDCYACDRDDNGQWAGCLSEELHPYLAALPRDPSKKYYGYCYQAQYALYGAENEIGKQTVYLTYVLENNNPNVKSAYQTWFNTTYGFYNYQRVLMQYGIKQ